MLIELVMGEAEHLTHTVCNVRHWYCCVNNMNTASSLATVICTSNREEFYQTFFSAVILSKNRAKTGLSDDAIEVLFHLGQVESRSSYFAWCFTGFWPRTVIENSEIHENI